MCLLDAEFAKHRRPRLHAWCAMLEFGSHCELVFVADVANQEEIVHEISWRSPPI